MLHADFGLSAKIPDNMIQGNFERENLSAALSASFALNATRLPVNKPFWVIGSGLVSLQSDSGETIMNRNGTPMSFPVLLIRLVKASGEKAPTSCSANALPNKTQRFPESVVATTADQLREAEDTLFVSTVARDVRDAVDANNQYVRIAHTGVVADAARAAQAANYTNEAALVAICKAIYAVQDSDKAWVLKPRDCTKLTRDGRRYPTIYVDMVPAP